MPQSLRVAELLCTRLCHDLTGPIGAVSNGAEFLEEEEFGMEPQALELIISSAREAVARMQFFRHAYGRLNSHGEASLSEKKEVVEAYFASTKVTLDWPNSHTDAAGISISQKMARLLLNMLIIAASTLIKGGKISVRLSGDNAGKREISVAAAGELVKLHDDTEAVLSAKTVDILTLTPKTVQIYVTKEMAETINAELTHTIRDGEFTITATQNSTSHTDDDEPDQDA